MLWKKILQSSTLVSMEIYGIGNDIIEIDRILQSIQKHQDHFLKKIFTDSEIKYCKSFHNFEVHFAGRYAAKEAISKALGVGFGKSLKWLDFEIINDLKGKPEIIFSNDSKWKNYTFYLSISHAKQYASAVALCLK